MHPRKFLLIRVRNAKQHAPVVEKYWNCIKHILDTDIIFGISAPLLIVHA